MTFQIENNMKHLLFLISLIFLFSCSERTPKESNIHEHNLIFDEPIEFENGSCPFFTKDSKGNIVMSWVMDIDETNHVFCYSIADENGNFGKSTVIPVSTNVNPHNENIPKIAFKENGDIIAVWGVKNPNPHNKYSGKLLYSVSTDEGKTWSEPHNLVNDTNML